MAYLIFGDKLYKVPHRVAKKLVGELTAKKVKRAKKKKAKK